MNPALASLRTVPSKVLHYVGQINLGRIHARLAHGVLKNPAGRSDERSSVTIFLIAGLFSDKHHSGSGRSVSEDCLGGVLPQFTCLAMCCRTRQATQGKTPARTTMISGQQVVDFIMSLSEHQRISLPVSISNAQMQGDLWRAVASRPPQGATILTVPRGTPADLFGCLGSVATLQEEHSLTVGSVHRRFSESRGGNV